MYKNLFLNTDLGVVYIDQDSKILDLNPAAEKILGISLFEAQQNCPFLEKWETIEENGNALVDDEHPAYLAFNNGVNVRDKILGIKNCKNKQKIWLKMSAFPEFVEGETSPSKVIVTFSDITDKILAEESLRESVIKIRTIYDSINDALLIHPFQEKGFAKFIEVNKEACKRYGYTKEEFLNLTADDITKKDDVKLHGTVKNRNKLLVQKNRVFDTVHITKSGEEIPVEINSNIAEFNNKLVIVAVVRDIKDRKIIEEKIRENEDNLGRAFDVAKIGHWEYDVKSDLYKWSDYAKKIIDYDEINKYPSTYEEYSSQFHPDDLEMIHEEVEKSKKLNEFNIEHRILFKNKEIKWIRIKSKNIFDEDGKVCRSIGIIQDITKQKVSEIALKESETRFKSLIEKAPYAVYLSDMEGNILVTNEIATSQLGYSKEEFYTKTILDIEADHNSIEEIKEVWKELTFRHNLKFNGNHLKKDGKKLPVEIITSLINIVDEPYVLGFVTDISDKIKAEEQLKLTQFGIDHSQIGVYQIDEDGFVKYANEHACNSLGYTKDEILNLSIIDIDPRFNHVNWKEHRKKTRSMGVNTIETLHKRKDGSVFPVEITINYIEFEDKKVSFSFAKDITESKRILEALKTSEARLSAAMKISKLAYWEYDVEEALFTFNDQFYSIFQTSIDEVGSYKMSADEFSETFIYRDDRDLVRREIGLAMQASDDKKGKKIEHRILYKNGEVGYISVNLYVVLDAEGKVIKTYGANQDITDRKKIENELIVAKNLAEENDQLKTSFLNNMSHEIRTPLNVILGYTGLIGEESGDVKNLKELTEPIQRSANQLQKIIEDILDISRIETGQLTINIEDVDLNKIVEQTITELKLKAEAKNIQLIFSHSLKDNESLVNTDLVKLQQILNNLVANAILYTNEGSVKISLRSKTDETEFCIEDTGIGIEEKYYSTIFERFQRLEMINAQHYHSSTKGGTGLGLAISKALVELLGGRIWLDSVKDIGTKFYFTIPHKN